MSQVVCQAFDRSDLKNKEQYKEIEKSSDVKIFNHIGKKGEKFLCMKFNAVLKIKRNTKKNLKQEKQKTSFELLQEIMDRINEK